MCPNAAPILELNKFVLIFCAASYSEALQLSRQVTTPSSSVLIGSKSSTFARILETSHEPHQSTQAPFAGSARELETGPSQRLCRRIVDGSSTFIRCFTRFLVMALGSPNTPMKTSRNGTWEPVSGKESCRSPFFFTSMFVSHVQPTQTWKNLSRMVDILVDNMTKRLHDFSPTSGHSGIQNNTLLR